MHPAALENAKKFIDKYLVKKVKDKLKILDVGSFDVNGSLRPLFNNPEWEYIGADIAPGKNVDVVLKDTMNYPFQDSTFDVIVSTTALEHDSMFWMTFSEMVRITKTGGHIYICAPSAGHAHRYPLDCWRFYPDAYKALSQWRPEAKLVETYIDQNSKVWKDNVGIFIIERK